jgi:hypothetical protein
MTRKTNLSSYLPQYLTEYKELAEIMNSEDTEFEVVWNAADRVLYNEFILTCDEDGITRFEQMLNITPQKKDTLESRKLRVQSRWFVQLPYTWKSLMEKMVAICGDNDFQLTKKFDEYRIDITASLSMYDQVKELENMLNSILPCNMVFVGTNKMEAVASGTVHRAGTVVTDIIIGIDTRKE